MMQVLVGKRFTSASWIGVGGICNGHRGNRAVGRVPPRSTKPNDPRSAAGILPAANAGDVQIGAAAAEGEAAKGGPVL